MPKTPVTFGESSGLINGPVLIWLSESSSVFKAEKRNEIKVAKRGGECNGKMCNLVVVCIFRVI